MQETPIQILRFQIRFAIKNSFLSLLSICRKVLCTAICLSGILPKGFSFTGYPLPWEHKKTRKRNLPGLCAVCFGFLLRRQKRIRKSNRLLPSRLYCRLRSFRLLPLQKDHRIMISPTLTASSGCLIKRSVIWEMCTSPS